MTNRLQLLQHLLLWIIYGSPVRRIVRLQSSQVDAGACRLLSNVVSLNQYRRHRLRSAILYTALSFLYCAFRTVYY